MNLPLIPPYSACVAHSAEVHENETLHAWQDTTLKAGTLVRVQEHEPEDYSFAVFIEGKVKGELVKGYVDRRALRPVSYFISGHLDLTQAEFVEHYRPQIDKAVAEGASFVVGDARGTDVMAMLYLAGIRARVGQTASVTVFHMLVKPRHNAGFPLRGGFKTDDERDAAMTAHSQRDIAWVRPGRERSGTAKNIARRQLLNQAADEHLFEILDDIAAKEGSSPV